ncbi:FAD-dependent oxidoreductase [Streptomyces sp. TRM64462]|uniref:NAD(P)/FAD-dependent oxidoreductase n=1 Tax=Streptomyces sp. TRM64462 TaxID=2741726 RepID=UPI001586A402|nr:FAD-dependent oxidoreductase [Streptomyces sp. TRM64462]
MSEIREVIVIGCGPAGYTAGGAIFISGSLTTTTEVENFPGFPHGVDGPVLMENMRAQAERFGAEIVEDDVVSVDLHGDIKEVTDSAGTVHRAKAVIVATGSGYRKLGLPGEEDLSGVAVRNNITGETRDLDVTGLFVAIGHDPRSELFKSRLDLDDEGYITVQSPSTRTNIPGVFAAGDVVDHTYRQAVTAAASGCAAALDAERHLADVLG